MIQDLIDFFETAPLDEVTKLLKEYDVEFVQNRKVLKYENLLDNQNRFINKNDVKIGIQSTLSYKTLKDPMLNYEIQISSNEDLDNYTLSRGVVA